VAETAAVAAAVVEMIMVDKTAAGAAAETVPVVAEGPYSMKTAQSSRNEPSVRRTCCRSPAPIAPIRLPATRDQVRQNGPQQLHCSKGI
jgi:hypothetical protein